MILSNRDDIIPEALTVSASDEVQADEEDEAEEEDRRRRGFLLQRIARQSWETCLLSLDISDCWRSRSWRILSSIDSTGRASDIVDEVSI